MSAVCKALGEIVTICRLPSFRFEISLAPSNTFRCLETAAKLMSYSCTSSPTEYSRLATRSNMSRLVGSASEAKMRLRVSERLTIWLNIKQNIYLFQALIETISLDVYRVDHYRLPVLWFRVNRYRVKFTVDSLKMHC